MTNPLSPEVLVPRLGEYLVQNGTISDLDLRKALAYQIEMQNTGKRCFLGQALLDLGLLERSQLDHAVTEQIIQLRNALEDANRSLERRVGERTADLQNALVKLSELGQMKANFIANISHELRTPLTHIKGYLELLLTKSLGDLTHDQSMALQVSQRAAGQLEGLINNLIMISQKDQGKITLQLSQINVVNTAREILNNSREKASKRSVTLEHDFSADIPLVQADVVKISWVMLELLDNAIKFTPPGGSVHLTIQPDSSDLITVSVKDSGIGIPINRLNEIFEPFHQLDGSSTRRYGGTGLGLAMVRDILLAHGSTIEVESVEGSGSVFRFCLSSESKSNRNQD